MRSILHIVTTSGDELAREVITIQKTDDQNKVQVADLTGADADYDALLDAIFAADSIEVW